MLAVGFLKGFMQLHCIAAAMAHLGWDNPDEKEKCFREDFL